MIEYDNSPPPQLPANVVDLSDYLSVKHTGKQCWHERFEVDATQKIVICKDCNREVPAIDAMIAISHRSSQLHKSWIAHTKAVEELRKWNPFLRAVRELEKIWRGKMLPCCPHCHKGITAEGLARGTRVNKRFAIHDGGKPDPATLGKEG